MLSEVGILTWGAFVQHVVRRRQGPAIGRPCDLRIQHPHPTGLRPCPNVDMVALYEQANQTQLPRTPAWAPARDALYYQPLRQQARQAAVAAIWGSLELVWADIRLHTGTTRFIPAYHAFLSFK